MISLVGDRKGRKIGRTEVGCSFIGTLVKVSFAKLPPGFSEPRVRWDFPHVDREQGSAHWEGGEGEEASEHTGMNSVQKQKRLSLQRVLDQPMGRWIFMQDLPESLLSKREVSIS